MASRILITGGAGFIGSHLADALVSSGHSVRVLDDLNPQVHGPDRRRPPYLGEQVELIVEDVRDRAAATRALKDFDSVYHFASRVGVGQSMYALADYASVNSLGTAVLLEAMLECRVRRLVVASSMSIYGEGLYVDPAGRPVSGVGRTVEQLRHGNWEPRGPGGERLTPVATPESKPPALESVYALTKFDQERMCLMVGRAYDIDVVALRLFNTYGPRQALSNPYTGVLAIFASRLLNGNRPIVYEDGLQQRDFVHVGDVVRACVLALDSRAAVGQAINIGSGRPRTIRELAERAAVAVGKPNLGPEVTGSCRVGDVRHCFGDIGAARTLLGFEPRIGLDEGLHELASWLRGQVARDRVVEARAELETRGLTL
jgi:dTDP-L-rhamnose 4-epimerase